MLSGKASLLWFVGRYKVKIDEESGIKNDPIEYSNDPRYILDLLKRVATVNVKIPEIVRGHPALTFEGSGEIAMVAEGVGRLVSSFASIQLARWSTPGPLTVSKCRNQLVRTVR